MKNKNRILKNNLNISAFKENLSNQQDKLIQFYNDLDSSNNTFLEKDSNYYKNNLPASYFNNRDELSLQQSPNIFTNRLNQTKDNLIKQSKEKWPNINICKNILDLKRNVKLIYN
jgi:hypothetical protein